MFDKAKQIIEKLVAAGGQALLVGGCVRDQVMGTKPEDIKDIDIEVYKLNYDQIVAALPDFHTDLVGKAFGVVKIDNCIDVSIPRTEVKTGEGHKGFTTIPDPFMPVDKAAARRDFTINSMAMDTNGNIIDFYGGLDDVRLKILRHTSEAFKEDPVRVLRGMQFAARFGFTMHPETAWECREILNEAHTMSPERVYGEWHKWATKGKFPSMGLRILEQTRWSSFFPELEALINTPQDNIWHPEGSCWTHVALSCDAAAKIADRRGFDEQQREILMFAALCHDLGKPSTTITNEHGRIVSPDHTSVGVPLARSFLNKMRAPSWLVDTVCPLVDEHMAHVARKTAFDFHENIEPTERVVKRLANRLAPATIDLWAAVCEADHSGRDPLPHGNPVSSWEAVAAQLAVQDCRPRPILMGRHLLEAGYEPGPIIGQITKTAFEAQLDGLFSDLEGAKQWLANLGKGE